MLVNKIGIDVIQAHNQALSATVMDSIPKTYVSSPTSLDKKGGSLVHKFPDQKTIEQRILDVNLLFDLQQYGVRLSPHIYTTEHDIDILVDCATQLTGWQADYQKNRRTNPTENANTAD